MMTNRYLVIAILGIFFYTQCRTIDDTTIVTTNKLNGLWCTDFYCASFQDDMVFLFKGDFRPFEIIEDTLFLENDSTYYFLEIKENDTLSINTNNNNKTFYHRVLPNHTKQFQSLKIEVLSEFSDFELTIDTTKNAAIKVHYDHKISSKTHHFKLNTHQKYYLQQMIQSLEYKIDTTLSDMIISDIPEWSMHIVFKDSTSLSATHQLQNLPKQYQRLANYLILLPYTEGVQTQIKNVN